MLKQLRKNNGLSQKELSDKSNVSLRNIRAYEQLERNINGAGLETLASLSIALHCRITDLLTDKELIEKCERTTL